MPVLDLEIMNMDVQVSGSRNLISGAISGSRNQRNGRQILYKDMGLLSLVRLHLMFEQAYEKGPPPKNLKKISVS